MHVQFIFWGGDLFRRGGVCVLFRHRGNVVSGFLKLSWILGGIEYGLGNRSRYNGMARK